VLLEKERIRRSAARPLWRENLANALSRMSIFERYDSQSPRIFAFGRSKWLLLLALMILVVAPNQSRSASATDDLYQIFQVDLPSADIVILFDASLSMRNHQYGDVRQAMIDFAPALTDKENLHLRVFGDAVSNPLEGKGSEVAASIESHLPKEPLFNHTDLGLALLKGLDFLEREGASQVQAFFLLTDGLHQPPDGSPYGRDFAHDPNWQALQRRAQALCSQHNVFVYGFGLVQQTDIAVLRQVFPAQNVEVIVGNASQVVRALQQVRERLRRAQLRQAIEQELTEGKVEVRLAKNSIDDDVTSFDLPLTIRNTYRHLSIHIERVEVQRAGSAGNEIECILEDFPTDIVLEPGQQLQVNAKGRLRADHPGLRIGEARQSYAATFQFVPVVRFQPQAALDELDVGLSPRNIDSASLAVNLSLSYGIPYWSLIGAVLMVAGIVGIAVAKLKRATWRLEEIKQRQAERRRLAGTLKIWRTQQAEPEGNGINLSSYCEEKLEMVIIEGDRLEVITPGSQPGEVVARLSGVLIGALSDDGVLEKPEFYIEPAGGHHLAYEAGSEMCEAARLTLCANDVFEMDGQWRLRYINEKLRTRAEFESVQAGGV
jgi:von Willebrand factor type A domain